MELDFVIFKFPDAVFFSCNLVDFGKDNVAIPMTE